MKFDRKYYMHNFFFFHIHEKFKHLIHKFQKFKLQYDISPWKQAYQIKIDIHATVKITIKLKTGYIHINICINIKNK